QFIVMEKLEIHSDYFERPPRSDGARVVFAGHQQHAGLMKQLLAPDAREEHPPDGQRTMRPSRVNFIGAVTRPDDARFAARTRAIVRRAVSVNQRDAQSRPLQVICGPGPENSGADYCRVIASAHVFSPKIPVNFLNGTYKFYKTC